MTFFILIKMAWASWGKISRLTRSNSQLDSSLFIKAQTCVLLRKFLEWGSGNHLSLMINTLVPFPIRQVEPKANTVLAQKCFAKHKSLHTCLPRRASLKHFKSLKLIPPWFLASIASSNLPNEFSCVHLDIPTKIC